MNVTIIALSATVICLALIGSGVLMASHRNRALEQAKAKSNSSYKNALEASKSKEYRERVYKAETGHIPSQISLGNESEMSDPREALYWYELAARADNEIAMTSVVRLCNRFSDNRILHHKGEYWGKAITARGGDKTAQFKMALHLMKGQGVEQDVKKGIRLIQDSAEHGLIEAQLYLNDWYISDANPSPNSGLAVEWIYQAASHGSIEGMIRLGHHYAEGLGVEKNHIRAAYWLECAAETGNGRAQFCAGEIWAGKGEKGNHLAYIWFYLSARAGFSKAKKRLDEITNEINIESIVGLQKLTKPIILRLDEGKIKKHSIIKALNKMFSREQYFPEIHGDEFTENVLEKESETAACQVHPS